MPEPKERWHWVSGWEGYYEVSDTGRVRSVHPRYKEARILKGQIGKTGGYRTVQFSRDGKHKRYYVHVLVAAAFIGPRPPDNEVRHGPGGKLDNSVANLSYGTRSENARDKIRDGTNNNGSRHGLAKLTESQIKVIRSEYSPYGRSGKSMYRLAAEYGVSQAAINKIVSSQTWRHV